jgi:hypothetical protein
MYKKIVAGYKGVIDLDLSNIHPVYHKQLINGHKKDIEDYKLYQETLDPEFKYENTIGKIMKDKNHFDKIRDEKIEKEKMEKDKYFRELYERYN